MITNKKITRITVTPPQEKSCLYNQIAQNVCCLLSKKLAEPKDILIITLNVPDVRALISRRSINPFQLQIIPWLKFCHTQALEEPFDSSKLTDPASDGDLYEYSEDQFNDLKEDSAIEDSEYYRHFVEELVWQNTALNSDLKFPFPGGLLCYGEVLNLLKYRFRVPHWKYVFIEIPPFFGKQELELVSQFGVHTTFLQYNIYPDFDRYCFAKTFANCNEITLKWSTSWKLSFQFQSIPAECYFLSVKFPSCRRSSVREGLPRPERGLFGMY